MLKKILKIKKAFLPVLLLAMLAGFLVAPAALAAGVGLEYGTYTGLGTSDLRVGVMRLIQYVLGFVGIIAIVMIMSGGFLWLTSAGSEEKITTAKKILINAVIGLAIILLSFAIASFIINQLISATGVGPGSQACTPNECVACYRRCNDTGLITVYDTTCDVNCSLPPNPPPNCPKPSSSRPIICAIKTSQPAGFGGLVQGKAGDYVTIEGWYFGDYLAGTSKVNLDTSEMALVACEGNPLWQERASDNYGQVRVKVPAMPAGPDTYDLILTNADSISSDESPFKVIGGAAGPQLACLVPPAEKNGGTLDKAEGENFGANPGQLIFNDNQPAVFGTWDNVLITAPVVPVQAVSGDVKVASAAGVDSNGVYFTVVCETGSDCASQCCQNFSCQPASACFPGAGEGCLVPEGSSCETAGQCQPGLICGDGCKCRLPEKDESCDLTADEACNPGACADDLLCSATDGCSCQPAPYIAAVSPNDGAIGNFITIAGKQFGDNVGWVYFVGQDGSEIEAKLADAVNGNCNEIWTDSQIIAVVPDGLVVGSAFAIKVKASGGKFDLTDDGRGPQIPDFTINQIIRPGLCKIEPLAGQPGAAIEHLYGINFITASQVFFAQVLAGGRPIFSSDFQTITGLTAPAMDPAKEVGVRVLNAAEYSNPLNFSVLASVLPPNACSKNPNVCEVDSSKCTAGQYCNAACECMALQPCGGDDPATSICEGAVCRAGFYCNDDCYCQPALSCDEYPNTPECDAGTAICPANYTCDSTKNCTCQPQIGWETESVYTWSFITTRQPGACSQDEGICLPDSQRCEIGFVCNSTSCNCDKVTTYPCSSDASHLTCSPDQTQCSPKEYCNTSCECVARIKCDGDPATPLCTPRQDMCPLGWYCYDESIHAADSNKLPCYCYQGILCDNPAQPVSPVNLACHPDNSYCPANYICDASSNCTCQKFLGALVDSTYGWTFNTFSNQPQVVEMCDRTSECRQEAISSPAPFTKESALKDAFFNSPRPDDGEVPIDAIISARFNKAMMVGSLLPDPANSADHPNIILEKCNDSDCGSGSPVASKITVSDCRYDSQNAHCFTLEPDSFLTKDAWYRVSLVAKNILGENGLSLKSNTGDFYRWMFKTRNSDELSQVACLYLQPGAAALYSFDQRQKYGAWPAAKDFICVDIRPESCNNGYDWSTLDATRAQIVPTADHAATNPPDPYDAGANDNKATAAAHNDTMLDTPPYTQVKATCNFSPPANSRVDGLSQLTIDFTSPRVIDRFPDCGAACLNARIGAAFSTAMDLPTLQGATKLYNCYDDPTAPLSACALVSTFQPLALQPSPPEKPNTYIGDVTCFDYNGDGKPDYCLLPGNYYRVVIRGAAKSSDSVNPRTLVGLNYNDPGFIPSDIGSDATTIDSYSWIFKTQDNYGLCLPGQIDVAPAEKWAPKDVEIFYAARPKTKPDACDPINGQRLNPYSWDWVWASTVPTVADLVLPLRDSCGNYIKEAGEDCDDGNTVSGDGCSDICLNEGTAAPTCGNKKIDAGEECDPPDSAAYCGNDCLWLGNTNTEDVCGNGIVEAKEECDPPGSGCSASCLLTGSVKDQSLCGDGKIGWGEECDGNELASGNKPVSGTDPVSGENNGCSAKCLIEDKEDSYCRSNINNIFDFSKAVCTAGSCGEGYNCTQLSSIIGNTNKFSTCANGLIEQGEECDIGGYCADDSWNAILAANGYPKYCNTYGTFCEAGAGQKCRAFEGYCNTNKNTLTQRPCNTDAQCVGAGLGGACWRDGCGQECVRNGSVYEMADPPNVGPYQIVKTVADGETDIKAKIAYAEPEGRGHLIVGAPPGKFGVIDYWPNCAWACLNAQIGGQFNQSADPNTLKVSTQNVLLYECGADGTCDISGRSSIPGASVVVSKTALDKDTFQINLPPSYNAIDNDNNPLTPRIPALIPNTFYRVVVRNAVLTADGKQHLDANLNYNDPKFTPAGGDISSIDSFSWVFKTQPQDDLCSLDKVEIIPEKLTLSEGNIRYIYFSQPWVLPDPYCSPNRGQKLNAYHYDWRWDDWETMAGKNGAGLLLKTADFPPTELIDLLPTNPTEADEKNLKDGCGNGLVEAGEDCDPGFQSRPGCTASCFWQGTNQPDPCGNGQIDAGEECDTPGKNYCSNTCLLTGNNNYNISVCGNGIVEAGEACDTGDEPDNDESDGCTDICTKSGAVPAADSICGDGQITKGEECDGGELARGGVPDFRDDCSDTGGFNICKDFLDKNSCEQVDFNNLLNNHIRACYWTGKDCKVRPCLDEGSELMGNNNYGQPVCGNGIIEIGEECDDGNITNGYCSYKGLVCSTIGANCVGIGQCLADGCGQTCLNNGSVAHDNRIDPFQIIETVTKLQPALSSVKEEIRAWYKLSPDRVGAGELTVVSGAEVPFAVVGHQPGVNATNQCPNAALWAIFSKPLDLANVLPGFTCADSLTVCDPNDAKACGNNQASCANKDNFLLCQSNSACARENNLIAEYSYRPVQGVCVEETQKCDFGDLGEAVDFGEFCQNDADCLGSQLLVAKLKTPTGFLDKNKDYYFDVSGLESSSGYCQGGRQVCQSDADCGGTADSCVKRLEQSPPAGREQKWTFRTGETFCECNYVGVKIDYTSGGAETINDLFTCAGDNCGVNTAKKQDDDVSPFKFCRGGDKADLPCSSNGDCPNGIACVLGRLGNQHLYIAQCWDVSHFTERQAISPAGIEFSWIDIDPDKLIFPADKAEKICTGYDNGLDCQVAGDCRAGGSCINDEYNDQYYITPGDDNKPAGKNGRSQVKAGASQYRVNGTGAFCAIGTANCSDAPAADQYISVINFICENPWPELAAFPYRDNESNLKAPDTNFEIYYCRDFGQPTTTDDLPALAAGPVLGAGVVRSQVLKEFIFPVGELAKAGAAGLTVLGKDLSGSGKIIGDAKFQFNAQGDWQYAFTDLAAGNYVVSVKSFNNARDLSGVSFCDSNANSYLEYGEYLACDPTDNAACANQPEKCLTGITHIIEVWVDAESQPRGKIVNFAAGSTQPQTGQTGQLVIGNLSAGNHTIRLKWLNDWFNNIVNPVLDSNLAILSLGLDREAAGAGVSSDALGIRVLPNPLHLSPQTWYKSGLCGGLESIDYLCFSDADCAANNLFQNGDFEAGLSPWEFQAAAGASGSLVETNSGQNGKGARLTLGGTGGWGGQLRNADNPSELIILPAGNYAISTSVKSNKKVYLGVEDRGRGYAQVPCQNGNCDNGSKVCSRQAGGWERLTCDFSLAESTNMQFIVRLKDEAGEVDIDNLLLTSACKKNVPDAGSGQAIVVDGYQAIRDGRSVYVGATNRILGAPPMLYSDIYLISYNQDADNQTKEIFNRILDQAGQKGKWYFNSDFTNNRICQGDIGYYENTDVICHEIGWANNNVCEAKASDDCKNDAGAAAGCYWSAEKNGCLAHPCFPIYCWNNFDCPNLECDANKEKVVRDSERFGDLRDLQLLLKNYRAKNRGLFPALGGGTYIAPLTFSVWPSWQETLGKDLGGNLYLDPLNRFKGCTAYFCDGNKNGKIDSGENTGCDFGDIAGCNNQPKLCLAKDLDQEKTCWQEIEKQFVCPLEMAVYAYQSANSANDYELYTNFEYAGPGQWGLASNFYALPLSGLAGGGTCQRLNFKASKNTITAPSVTLDCSTLGGDLDFDGICDNSDNCKPYPHSSYQCKNPKDCYNPDQRDSNGDNLGDACDRSCSGDKDGDRVCDDIDNCPNVSNPYVIGVQPDKDGDGYGDACDPCTDLDGDGWWDVKTSGTDETVCKKDNCPAGWCSAGQTPVGGCYLDSDCPGAVCRFDPSFAGNPLKERRFLASDRRKYCSNNSLKTCDNSGQCGAGGSCNDRRTYNPLQEDYDNDGIGYICDDCLDFDQDNKGDYSFYTKDIKFASSFTLTADRQEHFQGCQSTVPGGYSGFVLSTPDPNNYDFFGLTGGLNNYSVDFEDVSEFASWMRSKEDIPGLKCLIPLGCDINLDGDINFEDVSAYADKIIKTNKLDNCPSGPNGLECFLKFDKTKIQTSCANAATAGNWNDIFGNQHLNSQRDTNLNGVGDLCDRWGNGKLDPDLGEKCDCGDEEDGSGAAPNNPFTCTSGNGYPCETDSFSCGSFCLYCANGGVEIKKQSSATYGDGKIDRICELEQCDCGGGVNFTWTGPFSPYIYSADGEDQLGQYTPNLWCTTMNGDTCKNSSGADAYQAACCTYCAEDSQPAVGPAGGCCGDGDVDPSEECDLGHEFKKDANGNTTGAVIYKNGRVGPDGKIIGGCTADCKVAPGWVVDPYGNLVACDCQAGLDEDGHTWLEGWTCPDIECDGLLVNDVSCNIQESCPIGAVPPAEYCHEGQGCGLTNDPDKAPCTKAYCPSRDVPRPCTDTENNGCCNIPPQTEETCDPAGKYDWGCPLTEKCSFTLMTEPVDHPGKFLKFDGNRLFASGETANGAEVFTANKTMIDDPTCDTEAFNIKSSTGETLGAQRAGLGGWVGKSFANQDFCFTHVANDPQSVMSAKFSVGNVINVVWDADANVNRTYWSTRWGEGSLGQPPDPIGMVTLNAQSWEQYRICDPSGWCGPCKTEKDCDASAGEICCDGVCKKPACTAATHDVDCYDGIDCSVDACVLGASACGNACKDPRDIISTCSAGDKCCPLNGAGQPLCSAAQDPECACGECDGACPQPFCNSGNDPDCGCAGKNGCCGQGCDYSADIDCPIRIGDTITIRNVGLLNNSILCASLPINRQVFSSWLVDDSGQVRVIKGASSGQQFKFVLPNKIIGITPICGDATPAKIEGQNIANNLCISVQPADNASSYYENKSGWLKKDLDWTRNYIINIPSPKKSGEFHVDDIFNMQLKGEGAGSGDGKWWSTRWCELGQADNPPVGDAANNDVNSGNSWERFKVCANNGDCNVVACEPDGPNNICPENCLYGQDKDCGCGTCDGWCSMAMGCTSANDPDCSEGGVNCLWARNNCCAAGCNNTNDQDCPITVCVPDGCGDGNGDGYACPDGGACSPDGDPDCNCNSHNCTCGVGCGFETDADCPIIVGSAVTFMTAEHTGDNTDFNTNPAVNGTLVKTTGNSMEVARDPAAGYLTQFVIKPVADTSKCLCDSANYPSENDTLSHGDCIQLSIRGVGDVALMANDSHRLNIDGNVATRQCYEVVKEAGSGDVIPGDVIKLHAKGTAYDKYCPLGICVWDSTNFWLIINWNDNGVIKNGNANTGSAWINNWERFYILNQNKEGTVDRNYYNRL